jgi:hypothetical protein
MDGAVWSAQRVVDELTISIVTEAECRVSYRSFKANLATLTEVFSTEVGHDNPEAYALNARRSRPGIAIKA